MKSLSHVQLFATQWAVAYQAPPSMGFSRQEYWSGLPFPSPGDLPDPGIEPRSPALEADALTSEPPGKLREWAKLSFSLLTKQAESKVKTPLVSSFQGFLDSVLKSKLMGVFYILYACDKHHEF